MTLTLEHSVHTSELDAVDAVAAQIAYEQVEDLKGDHDRLGSEKVVDTIQRMYAMYTNRRAGCTMHVGGKTYDFDVTSTRTPEKDRLDEVLGMETVHFPADGQVQGRYWAILLSPEKVEKVVVQDGELVVTRETVDGDTTLSGEEQDAVVFDLLFRALVAKETYERRTQEERDEADASAMEMMDALGFRTYRTTSLE